MLNKERIDVGDSVSFYINEGIIDGKVLYMPPNSTGYWIIMGSVTPCLSGNLIYIKDFDYIKLIEKGGK